MSRVRVMTVAEANKVIGPYLCNLAAVGGEPLPLELKVAITALQSHLHETTTALGEASKFLNGDVTEINGKTKEMMMHEACKQVREIRKPLPDCWFCSNAQTDGEGE